MKTWKLAFLTSVVLGLAIASQANVIQDFEGYADTAALTLDLIAGAQTANASPTLDLTGGVGGSKAMDFSGHNGQSPYYTIVRMDVPIFSLDAVTSVDLRVRFNGGSNERFVVKLMDEFGGTVVSGPEVNTQTISPTSFDTYTIDTTAPGLYGVDAIEFVFRSGDYGPTSVIVDDITAIPEPATLGLFGLAGCGLLFLRRRMT